MKESIEEIISYYKDFLIKKIGKDVEKIEFISSEDIIFYERKTKNQFEILEELSSKYKLYDENYNEFMISMGKFSLGVEKLDKLKIDDKFEERIKKEFLNLHDLFEELEQTNIMKDVYVWKFVN